MSPMCSGSAHELAFHDYGRGALSISDHVEGLHMVRNGGFIVACLVEPDYFLIIFCN